VDGSHPREKPCGGGVTQRAWALIGSAVDAQAISGVRIRGAAFTHASRRAYVETDGASLTVVSREQFDRALLGAAMRAGATHIAERVTGLRRTGATWSVVTRRGEIQARWLLGADGANSLVRRTVASRFERADLSIAAGYFVRATTGDAIDIAFVDDPPGYLWSFPRRDHLAVGLCGQADAATSGSLLAGAGEWIVRHVSTGPALERYSWPIPSLRAETLARQAVAGDGWMLVGDAAGFVDPITREGIYFALESGALAAGALATTEPGRAYAAGVQRTIVPELVRAARLKASFFQPHFSAFLLDALECSRPIRRVMRDLVSGDQPYRGLRRRLLATGEWRLALTFAARRAGLGTRPFH
jgi:flavin-dependent dehydrogenase